MSDLEAQIRAAASRNTQLLQLLQETDHAKPSLQEQARFIRDLESTIGSVDKQLKDLAFRHYKELKDHEKYRDSNVRRFFYKAAGKKEKFAAAAEKEEREYFEVLQEEHKAKQIKASLVEQLEAANRVKRELEQTARRHDAAQQELDQLYQSIFSGPTPQFPQEDAKEKQSDYALQAYHDVRVRFEAASHVVQLLDEAVPRINGAIGHIDEALHHSRMDMFGGGVMSDMMERNALAKAETLIQQARVQVQRAQQADPLVGPMPEININHGNVMSDIFFDNIFTDMAFHQELERGKAEVQNFARALDGQLRAARERHRGVQEHLTRSERELERTRKELQAERERAFEKYAGGQGSHSLQGGDLPPTYEQASASAGLPPAQTGSTASTNPFRQ